MKNNSSIFLYISILIGILVAFSPVIITGSWYNPSYSYGGILVAEFIVRTLAVVIGLLIIYDGVKYYFSKND